MIGNFGVVTGGFGKIYKVGFCWFLMKKYVMRTNFLPKDGLIYVDTCALQWVCSNMDFGDSGKSLERVRGFRNEFRRLGNVSTSSLVLKEIGRSRDHYKVARRGMVGEKKSARREGRNILFGLDDMHEAERFHKAYDSVYDLLEDGMKNHPVVNTVSPDDVRDFVYDGDDVLSKADKELVYTALVSGNGCGFLSGDFPAIRKYRDGAREFHLPRAFICDAVHATTCPAARW